MFSSFMDWFHNFNCCLLLGVTVFVVFLFVFLINRRFFFKRKKVEYQFGELLCSVFPTLILLMQMFPSLKLLYYYGLMDIDSFLTLKVVGHQWYWSYDYRDFSDLEFDAYISSLDSLGISGNRLLDVTERCLLPVNVDVRFCITSTDVIHAWSLNNLSIKLDAIRGILRTFCYNFPILGVFYGQCSEICGANHSFMPICLEVCLLNNFNYWVFLKRCLYYFFLGFVLFYVIFCYFLVLHTN